MTQKVGYILILQKEILKLVTSESKDIQIHSNAAEEVGNNEDEIGSILEVILDPLLTVWNFLVLFNS